MQRRVESAQESPLRTGYKNTLLRTLQDDSRSTPGLALGKFTFQSLKQRRSTEMMISINGGTPKSSIEKWMKVHRVHYKPSITWDTTMELDTPITTVIHLCSCHPAHLALQLLAGTRSHRATTRDVTAGL